jgi:hypothetical protein
MNIKTNCRKNSSSPEGKELESCSPAESRERQIHGFAEELVRLAGILVREFQNPPRGGRAKNGQSSSAALLIARLVPGLDQSAWKKLAKKYALDSWLSIPVGRDSAVSAAGMASVLGDLLGGGNRKAQDEFAGRNCMVLADEKKFLFSYQEQARHV